MIALQSFIPNAMVLTSKSSGFILLERFHFLNTDKRIEDIEDKRIEDIEDIEEIEDKRIEDNKIENIQK